jgi:hypothetical protein
MAFVGAYSGTCYTALKWNNDILRMGVAGSLANVLVETAFHVIDTVNIRSKAAAESANASTLSMIARIYAKEGIYGFCKGFSACFYGACFSGFLYFSCYKLLKGQFRDYVGDHCELGLICMMASLASETLTLSV